MQPEHLAWHETLEIHELVAFQSIGLMKLKDVFPDVSDPTLKDIYSQAISGLSANIKELLDFFPMAPSSKDLRNEQNRDNKTTLYAGELLALFKCGVHNYAVAITETATPALRDVLKKQLMRSIDIHAKTFNYLETKNLYPAYDLEQMLENDAKLANEALNK